MIANIVIGAIIAACVALAIRSVYKSRKSGAACNCGCDGCSASQCEESHL